MHKIQVFYHTRQISGFPCVTLYINSEVVFQRCYIIITSGVELAKWGNDYLQLYWHSTPPQVCSWDVSNIFRTAKTVAIMEKQKIKKAGVEIFKNMGGNFPRGDSPGGSLIGGNFPVGSFVDNNFSFRE